MEKAELRSFWKPDEVEEFPQVRVELVEIGGAKVSRLIFAPGWRWTTHIQPLVHAKSCEEPHCFYHVSGVLMIHMDDGTELECRPGNVSILPPGHDAWVVGDEPAVAIEFQGLLDHAKSG